MIHLVWAACAVLLLGCTAPGKQQAAQGNSTLVACTAISEQAVADLFDRWNASLQTGSPAAVADNYAERSILLPTVSAQMRISRAEKEDYFKHFLENQPQGTVTARQISTGCNTATDSGLYTFLMKRTGEEIQARYTYTYKWENGQWLITSHHSSIVPAN